MTWNSFCYHAPPEALHSESSSSYACSPLVPSMLARPHVCALNLNGRHFGRWLEEQDEVLRHASIKDALCARTYHHVGVAGTRIARDREDRADQPGRGHGLRVYARARTSARLSVSGTNDRAVGSAGRPRRMKEDEHDGGLDEVIRGPPV